MKTKNIKPKEKPLDFDDKSGVELYQSVFITFSDGTKAGYVGKAEAFPGDERTIANIEFTTPKILPANCSFGVIEST